MDYLLGKESPEGSLLLNITQLGMQIFVHMWVKTCYVCIGGSKEVFKGFLEVMVLSEQ